jgi:Adenylate and Guanylate cyclase catalytic domain
MQVEMALREKDWTIYSETLARVLMGIDDAEFTRALAAYIRASTTPEIYRIAFHTIVNEWDVAESLPLVRARTLVLHNKSSAWLPVESGRNVAARIPGAQFRLVDDLAYVEVAPIIKDFVLPPNRSAHGSTIPSVASPFRTILFTDIEGHTAMMSRLGDHRGREVLREHERVARECLREHGGSEVKTMGDGFMATFMSAQQALECARALQQAFTAADQSDGSAPLRENLRIRIGVNAGEPIEEEDDLFGASVIVAARIAAKAEGGHPCCRRRPPTRDGQGLPVFGHRRARAQRLRGAGPCLGAALGTSVASAAPTRLSGTVAEGIKRADSAKGGSGDSGGRAEGPWHGGGSGGRADPQAMSSWRSVVLLA